MENKFKDWLFNNLIYFIIIVLCAIYILTAMFSLEESGKTIQEIIVNSALILVLGYLISSLFDLQGILKGNQTKEVKDIRIKHETVVLLVEPNAKELDKFCEDENRENLKNVRIRHLAKAGLSYDSCFNENGSTIEMKFDYPKKPKKDKTKTKSENKIAKKEYKDKLVDIKYKKKMFNKAIRVKLTQLTSNSLLSNSKKSDRFDFGYTVSEYLKKSLSSSIFSRLLIAIIFGYFSIRLIQDFSWSYLIWNCLQTLVFIAFGTMKYIQSYLFMQNGYIDRIKQQILYLKKFLSKTQNTVTEDYIENIANKVAEKFEMEK